MKKFTPNGPAIKHFRSELDRLSTQKEMANEIGVSIRMLRMIENENAAISTATVERIAKALGVHREQILFSTGAPTLIVKSNQPSEIISSVLEDEDKLIPRHDYDYAGATSDEGRLYGEAERSHNVACLIDTALTEETGAYAQELFDILGGLTWSKRDILIPIEPSEQIALRRRIRQLLVLLKGNDVWVYETSVIRRLPERYDLPPEGEPSSLQFQLVVALGPPGEYGETSMKVPIDHGQPFILPSLKKILSGKVAE
ncbi:helix-turn-helix transcriptional regulator [Rhizobium brockwellii]|uniref:helix-turn-helix transcriptional regulator n=1 Tax=Rhizobium brockwellii TaxID=3019932 RepID=UPI003F9AC6C1